MERKKRKKEKTPVYSNKLMEKPITQCYLKVFANETFNSAVISKHLCTSPLCYFVLSAFKGEWRRFKTAAIFQRIMLCLCPLPNDVSKPVYFSWKAVQRSTNCESEVSSFKAVDFCHLHPRCQFLIALAQQNSSRIVWNLSEK